MKKCTLLLILSLSCFVAIAQNAATPNPGFENWTQVSNYFNPNGWNNLNSNTAILGVLTCTRTTAAADVHAGTYSVKLTTRSVFGVTANGIASTATLITTPPYGVTGGIAYTQRPDSITGWYKYAPASPSDSGFVQFVLQGSAGDTIGIVKFCTPNVAVGTWTRFSKAIQYFNQNTPANSYWILSSSDGANPVVNSSIFIDDIDLVFNSTGMADILQSEKSHLLMNPVSETVTFISLIAGKNHISIFSSGGKLVYSGAASGSVESIALTGMNSGVYHYRLQSDLGEIQSGSFIKQ